MAPSSAIALRVSSWDRRILLFIQSDKPSDRTSPDAPDAVANAFTGASEQHLIGAASALNEEAWAEIYGRHAQQVYAYIYYRIGDQHSAEDLAADVFVKALAGIKGYVWRGTPLLAWLYRIAHNVTVDYHKSAARRMQHQAGGEHEDVPGKDDHLGAFVERSDMMQAISRLTDDQQQVVILRFYQGMSNAQVATVMSKPEGAVKALQSRALRSLRRIIGEGSELQETA